ncbi:MAG: hypothetical protein ABFC88_13430 [Thermoguttaceae bacterium]
MIAASRIYEVKVKSSGIGCSGWNCNGYGNSGCRTRREMQNADDRRIERQETGDE